MAQNNGQIIELTVEEIAPASSVALTTPGASWRDAIDKFIKQFDWKEGTRKLYARTLKLFFEWCEATGRRICNLTRKDIVDYKSDLVSRGLTSLSITSYLTSLRAFYEWAESEKVYPNIAAGVKTPKRDKKFKKLHLPEHKPDELLQYFQSISLRDYAIVNLLLRTGLRTIEVVRANVEDITFYGGRRVLRVWGKGHDTKDDFVILTDKAYQPIKEYLATRPGAKGGEPLFTSNSHRNTGGRLTTRTISGLCKSGLKAIGLDGREYTAHSLRHTTGVEILKRSGMNIASAQYVLRHTSPATTQIYVDSIKNELRFENAPESLLDGAFVS